MLLVLVSCSGDAPTDGPNATTVLSSHAALAASVPSTASASGPAPSASVFAPPSPLTGPAALAAASRRLLLVELWAPWCAPCAELRRTLLTPPNRARLAARVELVELDLDRPETAPVTERYGVSPLPSLLVLDPADGRLLAQRSGLLTLAELESLLDGAARSRDGAADPLAAARTARIAGRRTEAAMLFASAATTLSPGPARDEALVAALDLLREEGENARCVAIARGALGAPTLAPSARLALLQAHQLCALSLEPGDERTAALAFLDAEASSFAAVSASALAPHEAAQLSSLRGLVATERGDEAAARTHQEARLAALDRAIGDGSDASLAASLDADRTNALLVLGREADAVEALRARARALPDRYDVHGRLGTTLSRLGRNDEAVAPLARAVELAYGAPRLIYLHRLADVYAARGARGDARKLLEEATRGWAALPPSQRDEIREAAARRALADLSP